MNNPSHAPENPKARLVSFDELSTIFRDRNLYSPSGRIVSVEGERVAKVMGLHAVADIEQQVVSIVTAVRHAENDHELESVMHESIQRARQSKEPHELFMMASLLMSHRAVMRQIAKNPNLNERTQQILMSDVELRMDREVQMSLAHNPALTDSLMLKMIEKTDDQYVLKGIAMNAAYRSKSTHDDTAYAKICEILATSLDSVLRAAAIPGIKDANTLRMIAANNSVFLAPRELEAVAGNRYTPDDVLDEMANKGFPSLQPIFSIKVAEMARHTLANKSPEPIGYESAGVAY